MQASSRVTETFHLPQHIIWLNHCVDGAPNGRSFLLHGQSPESIVLDLFEKPAMEVIKDKNGQVCITLDRSYGSSIRSKNTRQPGEIMFLQEFLKYTKKLTGSEVQAFGWKIQLFFMKVDGRL